MLYSQRINLIFYHFYELQCIPIDKKITDSVTLCFLYKISSTICSIESSYDYAFDIYVLYVYTHNYII